MYLIWQPSRKLSHLKISEIGLTANPLIGWEILALNFFYSRCGLTLRVCCALFCDQQIRAFKMVTKSGFGMILFSTTRSRGPEA